MSDHLIWLTITSGHENNPCRFKQWRSTRHLGENNAISWRYVYPTCLKCWWSDGLQYCGRLFSRSVPPCCIGRVMTKGYLYSKDRRRIEQDAFNGRLLGIISTNALELGVDIGALDAVIMLGFPSTIASFVSIILLLSMPPADLPHSGNKLVELGVDHKTLLLCLWLIAYLLINIMLKILVNYLKKPRTTLS